MPCARLEMSCTQKGCAVILVSRAQVLGDGDRHVRASCQTKLFNGRVLCATGCTCIQWDRITDSGRILCDEWEEDDGFYYTSRHEVVSGEHDEVRRKVFYQGDPQTAVRRWPPRRVQLCEGCGCHFGSYVRTCDHENTQCRRAGRSVMVVSEGGDLAVTCVIRCGGGLRKRCRMSTNASGHCNLYHLPDRVIHRATEAADRARARALWNKMGDILFRLS